LSRRAPQTRTALLLMLLLAVLLVRPAVSQAQPRSQHIVFVIDNSGSMASTDPLRLRGVAASLILDVAELSSNVQAGLVHFSDAATSDGRLHPPNEIREQLQGDRLPQANGATNMQEALEKALAILRGSTAPLKKIVLITDGVPADFIGQSTRQEQVIRDTLVPQAKQAGVQIYALGLSNLVDRAFLDQVTLPTGGKTLVAEHHQTLLERAKELAGERDNVYTLARETLPSERREYSFELPQGVDRARLTVLLEQPKAFSVDEIEFTLKGPDTGDIGRKYLVTRGGAVGQVAAWTTFMSLPGRYTLEVEVKKPGGGGHLGLQLFVEALSILDVELTATPPAEERYFGDEVKVRVSAKGAKGPLDPKEMRMSGEVRTPSLGALPIPFTGAEGLFKVPTTPGRHAIVVQVTTSEKLGRAEAVLYYTAKPLQAPELKSSRQEITFTHPLGPERPQVEESFKLYPEFPENAKPSPVKFSVQVTAPAGMVELRDPSGGVLRTDRPVEYSVPIEGWELKVRISMDPRRPLSRASAGRHDGALNFFSSEAGGLPVPLHLEVRIPRFELAGGTKESALWWDPLQPRTISLGKLRSDLSEKSAFFVTLPEAVNAPDQGPKIADLALRIGGGAPETERLEGKLRYGPIDLPPGPGVPIELVVTPSSHLAWERLPSRPNPIEIRLLSSLGMENTAALKLWNVGGPAGSPPVLGAWLGPWSGHGRHLATWLVLGIGLLASSVLSLRRVRQVVRFWPFRPGAVRTLGRGAIVVGAPAAGGAVALALPNSGSDLDDSTLAEVSEDGQRQLIADRSQGRLLLGERPLAGARPLSSGDHLTIEDERQRRWDLEYLGGEPGEGGEVEIQENPAPMTGVRLARKLLLTVLLLCLLRWVLGRSWVADLAYGMGPVESFYLHFLLS